MVITAAGLFAFVVIAVWLFSLFDVVTTPPEQVRNLQKVVWVIIVLLGFWVIGAAFWFVYGRPRARVPAATGSLGRGPRRGLAPDDDIDFLRSLNKRGDDGPTPTR